MATYIKIKLELAQRSPLHTKPVQYIHSHLHRYIHGRNRGRGHNNSHSKQIDDEND